MRSMIRKGLNVEVGTGEEFKFDRVDEGVNKLHRITYKLSVKSKLYRFCLENQKFGYWTRRR